MDTFKELLALDQNLTQWRQYAAALDDLESAGLNTASNRANVNAIVTGLKAERAILEAQYQYERANPVQGAPAAPPAVLRQQAADRVQIKRAARRAASDLGLTPRSVLLEIAAIMNLQADAESAADSDLLHAIREGWANLCAECADAQQVLMLLDIDPDSAVSV